MQAPSRRALARIARPPGHPAMRRRPEHMKDRMLAHPDGSPAAQPLRELFHMR